MLPLTDPPVTGVTLPFSWRKPSRSSPPKWPLRGSIWKSEKLTACRQGSLVSSSMGALPVLTRTAL